jgi:hypothetical protein
MSARRESKSARPREITLGGVLAQIQRVGVSGLATVAGQEPAEAEALVVGEDACDRHG